MKLSSRVTEKINRKSVNISNATKGKGDRQADKKTGGFHHPYQDHVTRAEKNAIGRKTNFFSKFLSRQGYIPCRLKKHNTNLKTCDYGKKA